jgi:hypothetical protein
MLHGHDSSDDEAPMIAKPTPAVIVTRQSNQRGYRMSEEEKEAYRRRFYADRDFDDKKWGFDKLFGKVSGRTTVHIVGITMAA